MRFVFNNSDNEAMLKFELAHKLRNENILFGLEYKYRNPSGRLCIFDVVIYHNDAVVGIIECKKSDRPNWNNTQQGKKYRKCEAPIFLCDGFNLIDDAVSFAHQCIKTPIIIKDTTNYTPKSKEPDTWKVVRWDD